MTSRPATEALERSAKRIRLDHNNHHDNVIFDRRSSADELESFPTIAWCFSEDDGDDNDNDDLNHGHDDDDINNSHRNSDDDTRSSTAPDQRLAVNTKRYCPARGLVRSIVFSHDLASLAYAPKQ